MRTLIGVQLTLAFVCIFGWIINLCHVIWMLIHTNPTLETIPVRFLLECAGVVIPPLGVLMGWVHLFF